MQRKLIAVFLTIFILFIAYLGTLHLLPEDTLSPAASAWLQTEAPSVPAEQNAYLHILGIDAPATSSMLDYGTARAEGRVETSAPRTRASDMEGLCEPAEAACLQSDYNRIDTLLGNSDNALLLQRYHRLIGLAHYQVTAPLDTDSPLPHYPTLFAAQRLLHMAAVTDYIQGRRRQALALLDEDLHFARMLVVQADSLITRMMGLQLLANAMQGYSQLLEHEDAEAVIAAVEQIAELSPGELNLEGPLRGELQFQSNSLDSIESALRDKGNPGSYIANMLPIRRDRLLNISHSLLERDSKRLAQAPSVIARQRRSETASAQPGLLDHLYDPLYSIYFSKLQPDLTRHLIRHHDTNGVIRLVKLKAMLVAARPQEGAIEAFIAASPYASGYAMEAAPVRFDRATETLSYTSADRQREEAQVRVHFAVVE